MTAGCKGAQEPPPFLRVWKVSVVTSTTFSGGVFYFFYRVSGNTPPAELASFTVR